MQYRHLFPMLRVLLPFLAGIIVSLLIPATRIITPVLWAGMLTLTIAAGFIKIKKSKQTQKWLFGVVLSGFLFICGYNSVIFHKEILHPGHFANIQKQGTFIALVSEPLQEKGNSYKSVLHIKAVKRGIKSEQALGKVLVYFEKDSGKINLSEGCIIVFSASLNEIEKPQNPGAFNYRKYMATNNVYHQAYVKNGSWKILDSPKGFSLRRTAHQISDKFVNILKNNGLSGREFSVASALLLGQNDMLDNETLQMYSGSGVMHILSVSGLHVGVIYIIINFILGFIKKRGWLFVFKTILILLTIWAYSILTGLSPSVMRAAAMFTFITIGNASKRHVHIINSLAVSALFLLLIDPLMIGNIGFQLSYIAIFGIVFLNNLIVDLWQPNNRILEYVWSLIAVSIAAQIATAPLALFYFHQFPSYFIPANLVAIPVSFLAIYSGVAVLVFSFIPVLSSMFGHITNYLLFVMNSTVGFIEKLPYSVLHINGVFILEMLVLYAIIISIILFITYKRKELVFLILMLLFVFSIRISFNEYKQQRQQKIVLYSSGKKSAIGFISGKEQVLLADSALLNDKKAKKFQLDGAKVVFGLSESNSVALDTITNSLKEVLISQRPLYCLGKYFLFQSKRIAIVDKVYDYSLVTGSKLKIDYLIIKDNPKVKIARLLDFFEPDLVVIDGTNSVYKTDKWLNECRLAGVQAYSLRNSGALVVDL